MVWLFWKQPETNIHNSTCCVASPITSKTASAFLHVLMLFFLPLTRDVTITLAVGGGVISKLPLLVIVEQFLYWRHTFHHHNGYVWKMVDTNIISIIWSKHLLLVGHFSFLLLLLLHWIHPFSSSDSPPLLEPPAYPSISFVGWGARLTTLLFWVTFP